MGYVMIEALKKRLGMELYGRHKMKSSYDRIIFVQENKHLWKVEKSFTKYVRSCELFLSKFPFEEKRPIINHKAV